jgi:CheY-like chemotaxis protein
MRDRPGPPPHTVRLQGIPDLSRFRILDILLVSSLYDSFILAEDGQISELVLSQFLNLNLRHSPSLTRVSTAREALDLVEAESRINLVITSPTVGDMRAAVLAQRLREVRPDIAIVVLAYDAREINALAAAADTRAIDRVFLWQGDVRILPAIVKLTEDRANVAHDTGEMGVQLVIVIEDNVRFYSSFLPVIYTELMTHAAHLVPEGMNLAHKLMRLEARPKVLLCSTFEEAWRYFEEYEENTLGVISDIEFPKDGAVCDEAGVEFARRVRARKSDIPVMLQSSRPENQSLAHSVGASFLLKDSPTLLHDLRRFMVDHFGFGDFVFRTSDGAEVARAHDLKTLEDTLAIVPVDSVAYHAERNHFSAWLKARTEFELAHELRPRRVSDYPTVDGLRADIIRSIHEYRHQRSRRTIADFDRTAFDASSNFSRIGGGSLGGKARGLAFVNYLLALYPADERFRGVQISVPPSVVLGTDVFDEFLDTTGLGDLVLRLDDEREIERRFLAADLPDAITRDLASFLEVIRYPLAVRSSSLLEDSQHQPFAGVYQTHMLPNCDPRLDVRLRQLAAAVKRVYASTFASRARAYLRTVSYRLEEERMAVIIQRVVGAAHGPRFYPHVSGVARSHNFYALPPARPEDGIVAVALGFGETVVSGRPCIRFCPRYPRHLVQFSSVRDLLENSQRDFHALALDNAGASDALAPSALTLFDLTAADDDRTLAAVASTYSPENDVVYDGQRRGGVPLVTFAPMLKQQSFPLAAIVEFLLQVGVEGVGGPVEIEFAVSLAPAGVPHDFGFLQLRPLAAAAETAAVELDDAEPRDLICASDRVVGSGRLEVRDLLVVDPLRFDRGRSRDVAADVASFNARMMRENVPFVLIGVGRWGSADPFLGIPVSWEEIAGARAIVETGFRDFLVTPSQGTHFFQNLIAGGVSYFTVNAERDEGFIDWEWLAEQSAVEQTAFVRRLHFDSPIVVAVNGRSQRGVIIKPRC